ILQANSAPLSAAATGQALAIGAEGHAPDGDRVPLEGEGWLSRLCIPDRHRVVQGSAGQAPAVRTERQAHPAGPLKGEGFLVILPLPNLYGLVRSAACQAVAVRAEDHLAATTLEHTDLLACLKVPDP